MNPLKKLAGQTAVYGFPTIVGRLLNYFLVPLYTYILPPSEYGVVTELYAYVAFLMVILTYGMETTFFRFSKKENIANSVYNTSVISLLISSLGFICIVWFFSSSISTAIGYANHTEYIIWFAWILGLDALSAVPFARLRELNKARRFAILKSVNISLQIGFNLFFIVLCPWLDRNFGNSFVGNILHWFYNPFIGVGYIFISNLIASAITLLLLVPEIMDIKLNFDKQLWKQMLKYALPIMVWGMAGIVNETFDRILLKHLVTEAEHPMVQLGIYGACYKVAILMTLFIQTFKFAAEPFFFSQANRTDARQIYANVMKYFIIICAFIFLGVMMYIDIIINFVGPKYRVGAPVIPILLMANLCLGVFYNLSIWYKINDKTMYGAYISVFGAIVTLILNFWLVPIMGYMGAAWATLICYFSIMLISFILGQKHYYIKYDLKKIGLFTGLALLLYFISIWLNVENLPVKLSINTAFILFYLAVVVYIEKEVFRKILKKSND
ncbi:MAG: polysaccharide biosynthesis protein [Bacteroidetes bacterium]|nr:polysaccharide biosynthesis protein [Bacteroidota bacterium]